MLHRAGPDVREVAAVDGPAQLRSHAPWSARPSTRPAARGGGASSRAATPCPKRQHRTAAAVRRPAAAAARPAADPGAAARRPGAAVPRRPQRAADGRRAGLPGGHRSRTTPRAAGRHAAASWATTAPGRQPCTAAARPAAGGEGGGAADALRADDVARGRAPAAHRGAPAWAAASAGGRGRGAAGRGAAARSRRRRRRRRDVRAPVTRRSEADRGTGRRIRSAGDRLVPASRARRVDRHRRHRQVHAGLRARLITVAGTRHRTVEPRAPAPRHGRAGHRSRGRRRARRRSQRLRVVHQRWPEARPAGCRALHRRLRCGSTRHRVSPW